MCRQFEQPIPSLIPLLPANEHSNNEQAYGGSGDESITEHTVTHFEPVVIARPNECVAVVQSSTANEPDENETENDNEVLNYDCDLSGLFGENVVNSTALDEPQQNVTGNEDCHASVDDLFQNESQVFNESNIVNMQDRNQNYGSGNEGNIDNELVRSGSSNDKSATQINIERADALDKKDILPTVQMDKIDELALDFLINDDCEIESTSAKQRALDLHVAIVLEDNETAVVKDGKTIVTKKIDSELEMIFTYGETPKALAPLYHVKLNDLISGNIPFKENVCETYLYIA